MKLTMKAGYSRVVVFAELPVMYYKDCGVSFFTLKEFEDSILDGLYAVCRGRWHACPKETRRDFVNDILYINFIYDFDDDVAFALGKELIISKITALRLQGLVEGGCHGKEKL